MNTNITAAMKGGTAYSAGQRLVFVSPPPLPLSHPLRRYPLLQLMKQWSDAKHRVEEMKKVDPKAAEAMSKEITPRFQKEYFALQVTGTLIHPTLSLTAHSHPVTNSI